MIVPRSFIESKLCVLHFKKGSLEKVLWNNIGIFLVARQAIFRSVANNFSLPRSLVSHLAPYLKTQRVSISDKAMNESGKGKTLTRSRRRLKRLHSDYFPRNRHPSKFSGHKSCESVDINLSICHLTNMRSRNFKGWSLSKVFCKWKSQVTRGIVIWKV